MELLVNKAPFLVCSISEDSERTIYSIHVV